ncbi:hypothetical protein N656DRAFT_497559 [Canariomyces notabilis]|uniref:Uncharacterized protein n=1 Tax=Canariomyces notabilis TaxID=2074819 RepID=A0AAN6YVI6_9PEZI|nr:hypothetical protein N656DRAFT_497559 [Canariomyces arenarius]
MYCTSAQYNTSLTIHNSTSTFRIDFPGPKANWRRREVLDSWVGSSFLQACLPVGTGGSRLQPHRPARTIHIGGLHYKGVPCSGLPWSCSDPVSPTFGFSRIPSLWSFQQICALVASLRSQESGHRVMEAYAGYIDDQDQSCRLQGRQVASCREQSRACIAIFQANGQAQQFPGRGLSLLFYCPVPVVSAKDVSFLNGRPSRRRILLCRMSSHNMGANDVIDFGLHREASGEVLPPDYCYMAAEAPPNAVRSPAMLKSAAVVVGPASV